jgi:hypothetical protein
VKTLAFSLEKALHDGKDASFYLLLGSWKRKVDSLSFLGLGYVVRE